MKKQLNQIYIVTENDTLLSIAEKYNINPIKILITNNITPSMIKKGCVLYLN